MSKYVIAIRIPSSYEPSGDSDDRWRSWFGQLGENLVDPGNPVFSRRSLGDCGPGSSLGGYTLISAGDLDEAVEAARSCPILASGGGVEVGEITEIM